MFHPSIIPWETGDARNVNWNALPKPLVPPAAVWPAPQRPKDFAPPAMEHNVPRRWSPPSLVTRVVAMWAICSWICGALVIHNLGMPRRIIPRIQRSTSRPAQHAKLTASWMEWSQVTSCWRCAGSTVPSNTAWSFSKYSKLLSLAHFSRSDFEITHPVWVNLVQSNPRLKLLRDALSHLSSCSCLITLKTLSCETEP